MRFARRGRSTPHLFKLAYRIRLRQVFFCIPKIKNVWHSVIPIERLSKRSLTAVRLIFEAAAVKDRLLNRILAVFKRLVKNIAYIRVNKNLLLTKPEKC
jgi:hypothetical protein